METIEYLKSPSLVVDIQRWFGLFRNAGTTSENVASLQNCNHSANYDTVNGVTNKETSSEIAATRDASTTTNAALSKHKEEHTSILRLRNRNVSRDSELNDNADADADADADDNHIDLATSEAPSPKRDDATNADVDTSIAASLLNSGLEAHGIFSVTVREQKQRTETPCSSGDEYEDESGRREFRVTSPFWHVFFSLASNLGNEVFYCSFFPFWFWNVDTYVARRVIALWALNMYIGQALKDIIRWPRPASPPVLRLEQRYALEYGMPSTHAMVGVAIPFGLLITSLPRYNLILWLSLSIALLWTSSICVSRLYLGMHSVLDIIAGILFTSLIMSLYLPVADFVDVFTLTHPLAPVLVVGGTISAAVAYPSLDRWSTARGDTTVVIGTNAGVMVGSWLNHRLGYLKPAVEVPPYEIIYPAFHDIGLCLLRTCIGILILLATRAIVKLTVFWGLKLAFTIDEKSKESLKVEIPYKFLPYATMGFMAIFLCPIAFDILNIARITSYTEM